MQSVKGALIAACQSAVGMFQRSTAIVIAAVAFAAALLAPVASDAQDGYVWATYENPRFGYRIEYPAALFGPPLASQNGDGITLYSPDGRARLLVFGGLNTLDYNPVRLADELASTAEIDRVTYRRVSNHWLVLSGYLASGDVFYQRVEFDIGLRTVSAFRLDFPVSAREAYEPYIARMGRSLTPPASG